MLAISKASDGQDLRFSKDNCHTTHSKSLKSKPERAGLLDIKNAKEPGQKRHKANDTTFIRQNRDPMFAVITSIYLRKICREVDCQITIARAIEFDLIQIALIVSRG